MKKLQLYIFLVILLSLILILPAISATPENPELVILNSITENLNDSLSPEFNSDPSADKKIYNINAGTDENEVTFNLELSQDVEVMFYGAIQQEDITVLNRYSATLRLYGQGNVIKFEIPQPDFPGESLNYEVIVNKQTPASSSSGGGSGSSGSTQPAPTPPPEQNIKAKIWTDQETYGKGDYVKINIQLPQEKFSSCEVYLIDPSGYEFSTGMGGCVAGVTEFFDERFMKQPEEEERYTQSGQLEEFVTSLIEDDIEYGRLGDKFGTWGIKVLVNKSELVWQTLTTKFDYNNGSSSGGGGGILLPIPDNLSDVDTDEDNIIDNVDNCPAIWNLYQEDYDNDGEGNVCDNNDFLPQIDISDYNYNSQTGNLTIKITNTNDDTKNFETQEELDDAIKHSINTPDLKAKVRIYWVNGEEMTEVATEDLPPVVSSNRDSVLTIKEYNFQNVFAPEGFRVVLFVAIELGGEKEENEIFVSENSNTFQDVYYIFKNMKINLIKSIKENLENDLTPEFTALRNDLNTGNYYEINANRDEKNITLNITASIYIIDFEIYRNSDIINLLESKEVEEISKDKIEFSIWDQGNAEDIIYNEDGTATFRLNKNHNQILMSVKQFSEEGEEAESIGYMLVVNKEDLDASGNPRALLNTLSGNLKEQINFDPMKFEYNLTAQFNEDNITLNASSSADATISMDTLNEINSDDEIINEDGSMTFKLYTGNNRIIIYLAPKVGGEATQYFLNINKLEPVSQPLWNLTRVNVSGIENFNATVNGSYMNQITKPLGYNLVVFYNGNDKLIEFGRIFNETNDLDMSRIKIVLGDSSLIVDFDGQLLENEVKTLYLKNNGFNKLCVKNAEVLSASNISVNCDQQDEYDFTNCLKNPVETNISNILCVETDGTIKIAGLTHSGIKGIILAPAPQNNDNNDGDDGVRRYKGINTKRVVSPVVNTEVKSIEQPKVESVTSIITENTNENNPITGFTVLGTLSKYKKSSLITSSIILLGILGSFGFFKYRKFKVSQKSKK